MYIYHFITVQIYEHMKRAKPRACVIIQHTIITKLIVRPRSLFVPQNISKCHRLLFLIKRPSSFISNSNFLTKFNLNREIKPYINLNFLKQCQFQFWDGRNGENLAKYPLPSRESEF